MLRKIFDYLGKKINPVKFLTKKGGRVGKGTYINPTVTFGSEPYLISIGENSYISQNCSFVTHDGGIRVLENYYGMSSCCVYKKIFIGNNCFIGNKVSILPGVSIGNNCIVGYGSVVTKSIPDNEVWAGVPARKIESLEEYYKKQLGWVINDNDSNGMPLTGEKKKRFLISYFNSIEKGENKND